MKKRNIIIALMLSVIALMLSCKKSEPVKPTPEPTPVEDTVFVEKVVLSDTLKSVLEGESFKLNYTLEPADGYYKSITWTSSNAEVATVDSVGNVKALKEGEAVVKIAVDKIEAQCKVLVNKEVIHVENVTLNETSLELFEGETFQLTFTVEPENAMYETVVWTSTDETKATVDETGLVTAISAGAAGIKLQVDDADATCILLIKKAIPHVENVVLNETSIELTEDDTFQLAFTIEPEDAEYETVTWTSSNESVATVNENGLVTAISEGNAEIKVSVDDVEATCNVKVNAKPQGFALDIQITNITPNNAEFTIIPNDDTKTYYVYGMFKSKYDVESTYSELGIFGFDQSWYQMVGGSDWISYMLEDCHTGVYSGKATDYKDFITYDTEFVIYAYGFDEGGAPTTEVFKQVFSTSPMNPSNNNITVTINQVFANGVNATFHTTNSTQYYVTLQKKSYVTWWQENGGLVEMALDVLAAETYIQLLSGDATIQPDNYYYCNSTNTDYYIVYFSYDEANGIRSDIHLEPFHTAANK